MDALTSKVHLCKILDPDEETIVNINGEIYEPVLTLGHFIELKQRIEIQNLLILDQV